MARAHHAIEKVKTVERVPHTTKEKEYVLPSVDIYEIPDGYVLEADMPGVRPDGVEVNVDANALTIQGKVNPRSNGGDPVYIEFSPTDYFRSFALSNDIDTEKITADLRSGVLKVMLPKGPSAQARKIEIKVK